MIYALALSYRTVVVLYNWSNGVSLCIISHAWDHESFYNTETQQHGLRVGCLCVPLVQVPYPGRLFEGMCLTNIQLNNLQDSCYTKFDLRLRFIHFSEGDHSTGEENLVWVVTVKSEEHMKQKYKSLVVTQSRTLLHSNKPCGLTLSLPTLVSTVPPYCNQQTDSVAVSLQPSLLVHVPISSHINGSVESIDHLSVRLSKTELLPYHNF